MPDGMTKYGRSPWIDTFPKSRVPSYPRQHGATEMPVVILGGGLTGCATAYAFATGGFEVMLLEADQIGRGSTGLSTGWMGGAPGVSFVEVEKAASRAAARDAFRVWRRSALDFGALLRRLDIKCGFDAQSTVTTAINPDQLTRLKRDQKARRDAGLDAPLLNAKTIKSEHGLDAPAAIRDDAGGVLDPYRACVGLAAAAAARGAKIFERSAVRKITFGRRNAEVTTTGGSIRTARVVVATGMPGMLFKSLRRHFWFRTNYVTMTGRVAAKVRQQLGDRGAVLRDLAEPSHVVRWADDDRMIVAGADAQTPDRQTDRTTVQRTGQLMYELSTLYPDISGIQPEYGWEVPYARTSDGLPYIGPHRNFPHHLFAFGDSSLTVTGAYLASRLLLRHHLDELEPADRHFSFTRHGG